MRGMALAFGLAAIVLLANIVRMNAEIRPGMETLVRPERSLLAIVSSTEVMQSPEPVARTVAMELAPVVGCSRLGIFPRRDWAERVAVILASTRVPGSAEAAAVAEASSLNDQAAAKPWRVKQVSPDAYYLHFYVWGVDELAARMTIQRELLKKLLSINAIPEAC